MAKRPAKIEPKLVAVRLVCVMSGDGEHWNPGAVLNVDPVEAERLIGIGAAEAC